MPSADSPSTRPVRTPFSQRLSRWARGPLVLLVWIVAATTSGWLLYNRAERYEVLGILVADSYNLSTTRDGRITTLDLLPFQTVNEGDVLALLNADATVARIETVTATIDQLASEVDVRRREMEQQVGDGLIDSLTERRRFIIDETSLLLDALALEAQIETDRIALARVSHRLEMIERLVAADGRPSFEQRDVELQRDEISRRIEVNSGRLERTQREYESAATRLGAYQDAIADSDTVEPLLAALRDAVRVEQLRLQEIEIERDELVIRAPASGIIREILVAPGQAVVSGQVLATITSQSAPRIVFYVPAGEDTGVALATSRFRVSDHLNPEIAIDTQVAAVGPTIEQIHPRLWQNPAIPEFGRPVQLDGITDLNLVPGSIVRIMRLP